MHVTGDPDDRSPWPLIVRASACALPNRILARKELLRERGIDEHHHRRVALVVRGDRAPAKHGNAHRLEIPGTHCVTVRRRILGRRWPRMSLTVHAVLI